MIILFFDTEQETKDKLAGYTDLARHPTSPPDFALTDIFKHPTDQIWWFNGSDCIDNGGKGRQQIQDDIDSLSNKFEVSSLQELIDMGYLPQPDDN